MATNSGLLKRLNSLSIQLNRGIVDNEFDYPDYSGTQKEDWEVDEVDVIQKHWNSIKNKAKNKSISKEDIFKIIKKDLFLIISS